MNKKKIENYFNENKATAWLWRIPGICLVIIGLGMIIFVENGIISGQIFLITGVIWLVSSVARTKGKEVYDFTEKNVSEESEVLKKDIEKKLADYFPQEQSTVEKDLDLAELRDAVELLKEANQLLGGKSED